MTRWKKGFILFSFLFCVLCYSLLFFDILRILFLVYGNEGKRQLGRSRHRWEYNIKMDLQEMRCGLWTGLSWLRIGAGGGHL
jgi:hypothetical protein